MDDRTQSHINSAALKRLLVGDISADRARALLGHLEAGCEQCESLLDAEGPSLDTLLRLVQAELAAPLPPPVDLWEGTAARLEPAIPRPQPVPRRRRWAAWGTALAMAAGLSLVVLPRLSGPQNVPPGTALPGTAPPGTALPGTALPGTALPGTALPGTKGTGVLPAPTVDLSVVAGRVTQAGFDLDRRVSEGDHVRPDQTLLFELSVNRSSARYLFVVDAEGRATLLSPTVAAQLMPAGAARVTEAGQWVALTLDDLVGPLTLVAVAGSVVENPAVQVVDAWTRHQLPEDFGTAVLHVELAP